MQSCLTALSCRQISLLLLLPELHLRFQELHLFHPQKEEDLCLDLTLVHLFDEGCLVRQYCLNPLEGINTKLEQFSHKQVYHFIQPRTDGIQGVF